MIGFNLLVSETVATGLAALWTLGFLVTMLYDIRKERKMRKHGKKRCPHCATEVAWVADVCPACTRKIPYKKIPSVAIAYAVITFLIVVFFMG